MLGLRLPDGSWYNAINGIASLAIATTCLSAFAGMVSWIGCEILMGKLPTAVGAMCGAVAGLVTITPAAGYVPPIASLPIGLIGAASSFAATKYLRHIDIADDGLDVVACHGVCGFVGSIMCGIFASSSVNAVVGGHEGLIYGGGFKLLELQVFAVLIVSLYSAAITAFILLLLKLMLGAVRVSDEEEDGGLDIGQHAARAYQGATFTLDNLDEMGTVIGLLNSRSPSPEGKSGKIPVGAVSEFPATSEYRALSERPELSEWVAGSEGSVQATDLEQGSTNVRRAPFMRQLPSQSLPSATPSLSQVNGGQVAVKPKQSLAPVAA